MRCRCCLHQIFKCHKSHPMCTRCSVCCWNWFALSLFFLMCLISFSVFIAVPLLIPHLLLYLSIFRCLHMVYLCVFLLLAFPGIVRLFPLSLFHLPASITACWIRLNEPFWGTMPLQAWMHACVHVRVSASVRQCVLACMRPRLFPGENTDAAFCLCSCFRLWFVLLMLW